jgi:hypothetical protein
MSVFFTVCKKSAGVVSMAPMSSITWAKQSVTAGLKLDRGGSTADIVLWIALRHNYCFNVRSNVCRKVIPAFVQSALISVEMLDV